MTNPIFIIQTECILRSGSKLQFVGAANDYRMAIVERVNCACQAGVMPADADLAAIDHLPILDEADYLAPDCLSVF